jgi:hypothetical protein
MPTFIPAPTLTEQSVDLVGPITYGRTPGALGGHAVTGGLDLSLPFTPQTMSVVADASALGGAAIGGHNTLTGFVHEAIGDAVTVSGGAQVGHNTITINGGLGPGFAMGDAYTLTGRAEGGYNTVSSIARDGQAAIGDAAFMSGSAQGGHNYVTGGARIFTMLYGDAVVMSGSASGGHNTVVGADTNSTIMFGDAFELTNHAQGGGNVLVGASDLTAGPALNLMFGDGYELLGHASGGGNTLISGNSTDLMWGDAAIVSPTAHTSANTFEFSPPNGNDEIMDFNPSRDHIDLQGFGFNSFSQLDIQQTANGALISFDASDSILVVGVNVGQLSPSDFLFT